MKKLNNKGITTIEILLSFVIIVIITMSMYGTVSAFNEKRMIEEYKSQIYTYKNLLTKEIQDDFIKKGLTHVEYSESSAGGSSREYLLKCELKDGSKRELQVIRQQGQSSYHISGDSSVSDYYMIRYGKPGELIDYPLPDLGSYTTESGNVVKDLSINNVLIKVDSSNILSIHIGFYHPELLTRYGIDIVCPVDYVSSGSNESSGLDLY